MIIDCNKCNLYNYGIEQPYTGKNSKYLIIGQSPFNASHTLKSHDSKFWSLMNKYGFKKSDFSIIHSINCYTKGRPSEYHRDCCRPWIDKFIKEIKPKLIICCGNFALHTLTGKWGIEKQQGKIETRTLFKQKQKILYFPNPNIIEFKNMEFLIKRLKANV